LIEDIFQKSTSFLRLKFCGFEKAQRGSNWFTLERNDEKSGAVGGKFQRGNDYAVSFFTIARAARTERVAIWNDSFNVKYESACRQRKAQLIKYAK
jgi:hypothetical protein